MRLRLYLFFVWQAIAAVALALLSITWVVRPYTQVAFIWIGAAATTLLPVLLRQRTTRAHPVEPGYYLLLITSYEFVSRQIVSPCLHWLASLAVDEGPAEDLITWIMWLNSGSRSLFSLGALGIAAVCVNSRVWRIVFVLLFLLNCLWMWPIVLLFVYRLSYRQLVLASAATTLLWLMLLLLPSTFEATTRFKKERSSLHWAGVILYSLWLAAFLFGHFERL